MKICLHSVTQYLKSKRKKKMKKKMSSFSDNEKIELSRILESVEGRLDKRLIKLTVDVVMNTKWSQNIEMNLYKINIERIPQKAVDAMLLGSHVGQIYQVSLDFAKKLEINLNPLEKEMLKELVFFLVVLRTEKEQKR
jgi:hypothetical protein